MQVVFVNRPKICNIIFIIKRMYTLYIVNTQIMYARNQVSKERYTYLEIV